MKHVIVAYGLACLLRSAPYDELAGRAQIHLERERRYKRKLCNRWTWTSSTGAVEEMTQATADSLTGVY
jgi:hypothetical protein